MEKEHRQLRWTPQAETLGLVVDIVISEVCFALVVGMAVEPVLLAMEAAVAPELAKCLVLLERQVHQPARQVLHLHPQITEPQAAVAQAA